MAPRSLRALFRVAAGPRLGFGHLIRCRSLARALGVDPLVSLRATPRTRVAARRLGFLLADDGTRALRGDDLPCLLVVDDPSAEHAEVWVNRARRLGVPVAAVHDLGLGYVPSDLGIDASVRPHRAMRGRHGDLRGPTYAMLDPSVVRWRDRRRVMDERRVLVALGGGSQVVAVAGRLSDAIARECPGSQVRIACGFTDPARLPALSSGEWVSAPDGLGEELAGAAVAVVAGGVSLYEACAIGTPGVALALTQAQALTIRGVADAGAVVDVGRLADPKGVRHAAAAVAHLLHEPRARRHMTAAGRRLVDGRGVFRVADALRTLAATGGSARHAA